jgi:hypothetical protein
MGAGVAIGGSLLGVLTVASAGSIANAQERNKIDMTVSPRTVTPGAQVRITAECGTSQATASSLAFTDQTNDQTLKASDSGPVEGEATVDPGTLPGTYAVDVLCENSSNFGEAELAVVQDKGTQAGDGSSLGGQSAALTATGAGLLTAAAVCLAALARRRAPPRS